MHEEQAIKGDCVLPTACDASAVHTGAAAKQIESRYIAEGTMGAIAPDAEAIFRYRGIHVLPDVYTLSGDLSVSAYEWTQTNIYEKYVSLHFATGQTQFSHPETVF